MAAESMGQGHPLGVLISSVFFGMADSLAIRLQLLNVPPQLIQMLPYVFTIMAIAIYSYRRSKKRSSHESILLKKLKHIYGGGRV